MGVLALVLAAAFAKVAFFPGPAPGRPPEPPALVEATAGRDRPETGTADRSAGGPAVPPPVDLDAADRDRDLFGRVVDARDSPVAGAKVTTVSRPWRRSAVLNREGYDEEEPGPETLTARDGTFLVRLRRGALVDLRVTAEGYAETVIPWCQAGERVKVVLHRGGELLVSCADESGAPVPGVTIRIYLHADPVLPSFRKVGTTDGEPVAGALLSALAAPPNPFGVVGSEHPIDARSSRAGVDGRFRLTSLRRDLGPHTLVVQAPDRGKLLLDFGPADPGPGTIDLGDVRLPPARAIEGRVLDASGEPLVAARVQIRAAPTHALPDIYGGREERRTDDLGRFRFPDLAPGRYRITVRTPGSPVLRREVHLPPDRDLLDVVIRREEAQSLTIRVLDPEGKPVAGARVSSRTPGASALGLTGPDGRVTLEGLPAFPVRIGVFVPAGESGPRFAPFPGLTVAPAGQEINRVTVDGRRPDGTRFFGAREGVRPEDGEVRVKLVRVRIPR